MFRIDTDIFPELGPSTPLCFAGTEVKGGDVLLRLGNDTQRKEDREHYV